mgnify:CR=1 FL=1
MSEINGYVSDETIELILAGVIEGVQPTTQEVAMARELRALRKILDGVTQEAIDGGWTARGLSDYAKQVETELAAMRERAEPVVCPKCGNTGLADSGGVQPWGEPILIECDCTAPPAPVAHDERYQQLSELYHAQEKRLFKLAQRIKGPSFDKYAHSPSQAIDVLEAAIFGENDDACRAAMLNRGK